MATSKTKREQAGTTLDDESRVMLYGGLNLSQLGTLFRMDHRVLVEKLQGVAPTGTRNGVNIWEVSVVAPYLVKPVYDIETYIKRMNHADLPKQLTKEFWAGLKNKQDYELRAGNLWPTEKIVSTVGELMKLVKMSVLLMADTVEHTTELSDKQRAIIKNIGDSMLAELQHKVIERFQNVDENYGDSTNTDEEL